MKTAQKDDFWWTTTYEGNSQDQFERYARSTYDERYRWLVETYEFLKGSLPARPLSLLSGSWSREGSSN